MMWWSGSWGWEAWLAMSLGMLVFWALVAWVIVVLVKSSNGWRYDGRRDPRDILDERYARGEIDEDEYKHRRELLSSGP